MDSEDNIMEQDTSNDPSPQEVSNESESVGNIEASAQELIGIEENDVADNSPEVTKNIPDDSKKSISDNEEPTVSENDKTAESTGSEFQKPCETTISEAEKSVETIVSEMEKCDETTVSEIEKPDEIVICEPEKPAETVLSEPKKPDEVAVSETENSAECEVVLEPMDTQEAPISNDEIDKTEDSSKEPENAQDLLTQNMLFVNSDNNSNDITSAGDVQVEDDPIASDSPKQAEADVETIRVAVQTSEVNDYILPDATQEEKYVITNHRADDEQMCMICLVQGQVIYSCSYKEATTYLCSEDCFTKFKDTHEGKFVKQGIRVKVFDMCLTQAQAALAAKLKKPANKCKQCLASITKSCFHWESYTFCDIECLSKFQKAVGMNCMCCKTAISEDNLGKYCIRFGVTLKAFCSIACFTKYKQERSSCAYCQSDMASEKQQKFCSDLCMSKYQHQSPEKEVKQCSVCHKEKAVEIEFMDVVKKHFFCGDPCFVAYKFVNNVDAKQCEVCAKYVSKLMVEDNSFFCNNLMHFLCSEKCRSIYMVSSRKIVKCHLCNVKKNNYDSIEKDSKLFCSLGCHIRFLEGLGLCKTCDHCFKTRVSLFHFKGADSVQKSFCSYWCLTSYQLDVRKKKAIGANTMQLPIITSVQSLADQNLVNGNTERPRIRQMVFVKPPEYVQQRNVATMAKPNQVTKGTQCKPKEAHKGVQTEDVKDRNIVLPIPVPIYVPTPLHMFAAPFPVPFPFPLPIPVPIFIPTTRNSAKGIFKEINRIKNKVPADPLEAELLMMAEMVAEDKRNDSDSGSDDDDNNEHEIENDAEEATEGETFTEPSSNFGEDMLQMALKMASDFEEPVDLEGEVSASTIIPPASDQSDNYVPKRRGRPPKHAKRAQVQTAAPAQKPDANLCLKYTFGVNAWKQWVTTKNADLEKSSRKAKLFKTEILQLTSDELNYSLCLFVKEVRKPNGSEYAPDTIYYLCLGIQQYLYENGRIDNIFCDAFYEKFTDCLNDVCRKFSVLYNESQYIVTRVEEEHLWESKQLGAHSPLVLLNTLMFFNTKHFSLTSVEEHLQLSFSHIMKHWKRNPNQPGARNVLLRFYPPQNAQIENRKKKMYEQQENEENPLRCPVKLYEFYLSKCPESVKTRNDVFYLLPERSCVPDSPLWYSTMALDQPSLEKMLNRVKMVKEINVALLTS